MDIILTRDQAKQILGIAIREENSIFKISYKLDNNKRNEAVEKFINENILFKEDNKTYKNELYNFYISWCNSNNIIPLSIIMFSKYFYIHSNNKTDKDGRDKNNGRRYWNNVTIK